MGSLTMRLPVSIIQSESACGESKTVSMILNCEFCPTSELHQPYTSNAVTMISMGFILPLPKSEAIDMFVDAVRLACVNQTWCVGVCVKAVGEGIYTL